MSRQLAVSACASILAMAAFVVLGTPNTLGNNRDSSETGAKVEAFAPAIDRVTPSLFEIIG